MFLTCRFGGEVDRFLVDLLSKKSCELDNGIQLIFVSVGQDVAALGRLGTKQEFFLNNGIRRVG